MRGGGLRYLGFDDSAGGEFRVHPVSAAIRSTQPGGSDIPEPVIGDADEPALVIVQARMTSARLPGKVLLPLDGLTVLDCLVGRIQRAKTRCRTVVATGTNAENEPIVEWARGSSVWCFRGDPDDVLARYLGCLEAHPAQWFVRITGDNPLVDPDLLDDLLRMRAEEVDRVAYRAGSIPLGLGSELVRSEALRALGSRTSHPADREHVTLGLYRDGADFRTREIEPPEGYPMAGRDVRLTLDEERDYEAIGRIVRDLGPDPSARRLAEYLDSHPEVAEINRAVEQTRVELGSDPSP